MSKLDFRFELFQFTLAVLTVGMVTTVLLHDKPEVPMTKPAWWAKPLLIVCYIGLIIACIIQFIRLAHAV